MTDPNQLSLPRVGIHPFDPNLRIIHEQDLLKLLEAQAKAGAKEALSDLGFDHTRREDLIGAMEWAKAFRLARGEAMAELRRWMLRLFIGGIIIAVAAKLGLKIPEWMDFNGK